MGKPRMTQRDRWQKRAVVVRYRAYADAVRYACGPLSTEEETGIFAINVVAYIAMPASWSAKKQLQLEGTLHRQKPDYDNISKAVGDAMLGDDAGIGAGTCVKLWCREGHQRTVISVLSFDTVRTNTP